MKRYPCFIKCKTEWANREKKKLTTALIVFSRHLTKSPFFVISPRAWCYLTRPSASDNPIKALLVKLMVSRYSAAAVSVCETWPCQSCMAAGIRRSYQDQIWGLPSATLWRQDTEFGGCNLLCLFLCQLKFMFVLTHSASASLWL